VVRVAAPVRVYSPAEDGDAIPVEGAELEHVAHHRCFDFDAGDTPREGKGGTGGEECHLILILEDGAGRRK
jgi:hypothetical protein